LDEGSSYNSEHEKASASLLEQPDAADPHCLTGRGRDAGFRRFPCLPRGWGAFLPHSSVAIRKGRKKGGGRGRLLSCWRHHHSLLFGLVPQGGRKEERGNSTTAVEKRPGCGTGCIGGGKRRGEKPFGLPRPSGERRGKERVRLCKPNDFIKKLSLIREKGEEPPGHTPRARQSVRSYFNLVSP